MSVMSFCKWCFPLLVSHRYYNNKNGQKASESHSSLQIMLKNLLQIFYWLIISCCSEVKVLFTTLIYTWVLFVKSYQHMENVKVLLCICPAGGGTSVRQRTIQEAGRCSLLQHEPSSAPQERGGGCRIHNYKIHQSPRVSSSSLRTIFVSTVISP